MIIMPTPTNMLFFFPNSLRLGPDRKMMLMTVGTRLTMEREDVSNESFIFFRGPCITPVDYRHITVEANRQPYVVRNGGIDVKILRILRRKVISAGGFKYAAEFLLNFIGIGAGFRFFVRQQRQLRLPAICKGNVEILFQRVAENRTDLPVLPFCDNRLSWLKKTGNMVR